MLGQCPPPRKAVHQDFRSPEGDVLDQGIAIYFQAPNSFTGEDVLEFQAHGGPVVLQLILKAVLACGARLARPGEFSERAFLNDKLDLVQAEAIADLINASTEQAARSALRSLQGEFSQKIQGFVERLIELRVYVEAAMDFPEEEVDFLADGHIESRLSDLAAALAELYESGRQGALLREGMTAVIAGKPNAGKSSLLNAMSGRESAIVTPVPGTTRDMVKETIDLKGIPLQIIDTAGLRQSDDVVEKIGIERALKVIGEADVLLLVVDGHEPMPESAEHYWRAITGQPLPALPRLWIRNKADLMGLPAHQSEWHGERMLTLSAATGDGIDMLRQVLQELAGVHHTGESPLMARERHLQAIRQARQAVDDALHQLQVHKAGELVAEELRRAQDSLSIITGEFSPDDLLGEIFSSFCIGK
jgi:tRNA modification GTPase